MKSYLKNNLGLQILLFYIFTHYIVQIGIHYLYYEDFALKYRSWNISPLYAIYSILLFLFFYILVDLIIPKFKIKKIKIKQLKNRHWRVILFIFAIVYLVGSMYFKFRFGLDFRQKHSLSEGGMFIQILWFMKAIVHIIYFYILIILLKQENIKFLTKISIFILVLGDILTLTSSMQLLWVIIGVFYLLPMKKLVFLLKYKRFNFYNIFLYIILFSFITIGALFIGLADKWGIERTKELFFNIDGWKELLKILLMRITTSYFSLLFMAKEHIFDFTLQLNIYLEHFHTFLQRLSVATHLFDYKLPKVETIQHENYLLLFWDQHDRPGATPGIIASIYYIFTFPFNFIIMGTYLVFIFRILESYFQINKLIISKIGFLFLFYEIYDLLQVPPALLQIIDPGVIYFLFYLVGVFFI